MGRNISGPSICLSDLLPIDLNSPFRQATSSILNPLTPFLLPRRPDDLLEAAVEAAVDDEVHDAVEDEEQVVDGEHADEPHGRPASE